MAPPSNSVVPTSPSSSMSRRVVASSAHLVKESMNQAQHMAREIRRVNQMYTAAVKVQLKQNRVPLFVYRPNFCGGNSNVVRHLKKEHVWTQEREQADYTLKEQMHMLLDVPTSSRGALFLSAVDVLAVTGSIFCYMVATSAPIMYDHAKDVNRVDNICLLWFTIFLFMRLIVCPYTPTYKTMRAFLVDWRTIADFACVLPYAIDLITDLDEPYFLAFLGVLKCARVFKFVVHTPKGFKVIWRTFQKSADAATVPILFVFVLSLISASCLYWLEGAPRLGMLDTKVPDSVLSAIKGEDVLVWEYPTTFDSMIQSLWFVLTTITTVGFGSKVVSSSMGRWIAALLMCVSPFVIAMPIAIVAKHFNEAFDRRYIDDDDELDDDDFEDATDMTKAQGIRVDNPSKDEAANRRRSSVGDITTAVEEIKDPNHLSENLEHTRRRWSAARQHMKEGNIAKLRSQAPVPKHVRKVLSMGTMSIHQSVDDLGSVNARLVNLESQLQTQHDTIHMMMLQQQQAMKEQQAQQDIIMQQQKQILTFQQRESRKYDKHDGSEKQRRQEAAVHSVPGAVDGLLV